MFTAIESSIKFSINRAGISDQVQAALVCEYYKQALEEIINIKNTQSVSFSRGVLIARAPSSSYASELNYHLNSVRGYINKKLNKTLVERISIVIG